MKGRDQLFSSGKDDWETPDSLYEELDKEFHFVWDLACNLKNCKCGPWRNHGFCIDNGHDALKMDWHGDPALDGWLWMNPPFSKNKEFIKKAYEESQKGARIVMLLPSRTSNVWFHKYIYRKPGVEIRFLKGRLKFKGASSSAPFPSMIVIMRGK
jgi:site-specific DNA-methyltransferase (adenine-specific)